MKPPICNKDHKAIAHNILVHDRVAQHYDVNHVEIYNPTEQKRINYTLQKVVKSVSTGSEKVVVLDFGAGTGNITNHLLNLDVNVIATDVSPVSLEQLSIKLGRVDGLQTVLLNGDNLANFQDNAVDMVATYSVLHHVPDYLKIIDEFVRVVKPGGVIYFDHEVCPTYWEFNENYLDYLTQLGEDFRWGYLLALEIPDDNKGHVSNLNAMVKRMLARGAWTGPILKKLDLVYDEGDIHSFKNDHIEWDAIEARLLSRCEIINKTDYLVCREISAQAPVWAKWQNTCADMRMLVARKIR